MSVVLRSCTVQRLDLRLHAPFGISGGQQDVARNLLVRIELTDGTVGWGEAAPLPAYNGETQEQAELVLRSAASWLAGRRIDEWSAAAEAFRAEFGHRSGAAQCAFETALLDALLRHRGESMWRHFGGTDRWLQTDITITTGGVDDAAQAATSARERGFRRLKVKIGGPTGPSHDLARLSAVVAAHPGAELVLDGNAGLRRDDAFALVEGLQARQIRPILLEQLLERDDLDGARALREKTGWTVAADEAVVTAADVARLVAAGAADVVNVKLMKAGLVTGLAVVKAARAAGLGVMIGGNVESVLTMSTSAAFAGGLGGFSYVDLDTPLFLAENPFDGGLRYEGDQLTVAHVEAGHGVAPAGEDGGLAR